jgi:exodeoxyribonuclease V beta subunit
MKRFDLLNTPLSGRNLIEASAGTGKTFTIAGLFVRLLLESPDPESRNPATVNRILVVTFTEAATRELRDRIRRRIRDALDAFSAGYSDDRFLQGLLDRHPDRKRAGELLFAALSSFDEAPVFTIHGFCQRMLQDNPFESGSLFDTRLVTDQEAIYREIAEDFWRRTFFSAPKSLARAALAAGMGPELLTELARGRRPGRFLSVIPDVAGPDPADPREPAEEECDALLLGIKRDFFRYLTDELPRRKRRDNVRFFDDLLLDLHGALEGERGASLAAAVRSRFAAALIDEFQDTDPVQYAIFDRIFPTGESPLFLIGDPKQAIYSFRGADVFAYLAAAGEAGSRYTLEENWRSEPALIRAVNALFARHEAPFSLDEIRFHPVAPARKENRVLLTEDGTPDPSPFRILFAGRKTPGKPIDKQDAWDIVPAAVASEIARLLRDGAAGRLLIDGRGVGPGDVAVVVRENRQARMMQRALRELGIPCVLCRAGNLFESPEAEQLLRILEAVARPGNESLVKAALVTGILGWDGNALAELLEDDASWERVLEDFRRYRDLWDERGFMAMAMRLLAEQGVRSRLLSLRGGERRLTNLLHCLETVHQAEVSQRLGIDGLLDWLTERLVEEPKREEHEIRLETDRNAVQLVTVHRSKGLEFPVVFSPFCWESGGGKPKYALFHDPDKKVVLDLGSSEFEAHRKAAEAEQLAEELRLLYVALTRAEHRAYLVWGAFKDAGESSLHYLLHPGRKVEKRQVAATDHELLEDLGMIAAEAGGAILVSPLPEPEPIPYAPERSASGALVSRPFTGTLDAGWRVASFTSFVSGSRHGAELPDRDGLGEAPERAQGSPLPRPGEGSAAIMDFPAGVKAGVLIHHILERLDFSSPDRAARRLLIETGLERYGFDAQWADPLARMTDDLLRLPLPGAEAPFTLSSLTPADRVSELEFFFPLGFVSAPRLREVLARHGGPDCPADLRELCGRLEFTPVRGMVRGFIDLVFRQEGRYYIVDWKSNRLGPGSEDYGTEGMKREMERRLYPLQYLLYTVALVRHLSLRVPEFSYEEHFGGVFYLFLRGLDPERPERGVFRDLPSAACIAELTGLLIETEGGRP